jgi:hypothetical protein
MSIADESDAPEASVTDYVGVLAFVVDNLERANCESATAIDAISGTNLVAADYHLRRMAAHVRAALGAWRDMKKPGK